MKLIAKPGGGIAVLVQTATGQRTINTGASSKTEAKAQSKRPGKSADKTVAP